MTAKTADRTFEKMILGGTTIDVEVTTLSIDELELDPNNPRIQYRLSLMKDKTLDEVILDLPEVKELRKDIDGNGGVRERPYVQKIPGSSKYKVIEGNCRTVCVRDLHRKYTTDNRWAEMPVRIFPAELSAKLIAIFLSDQHVTGKIPWKAHEQAGQIYHMRATHKMSMPEITRYLRKPAGQVEILHKSYEFMIDRFCKVDGGKYAADGEGKFSYFHAALQRKGIREALEKDEKLKDDFCRWVGDNRFPKSSDVTKLDKILQHPKAIDAWRAGTSLDDTVKIVEDLDPTLRKDQPIFKYCALVRDACGDLDLSTIDHLATNDPGGRESIFEARDELNKVIAWIDASRKPMREAAE